MTPAARTLWQRELVRFFRQPSRVVGAIGSPAIFWLLLGSGFGESFRPAASPLVNGYLEYFYPGTLALIVLFTAIFSTVSIIEDRHEGFLQGVLVAPVSRIDIVTGKLLGAATLATMQATIFLLAAPFAVRPLTPLVVASAIGVLGRVIARARRPGVRRRLAVRLHPGLPRDHESRAGAAVDPVGRSLSGRPAPPPGSAR